MPGKRLNLFGATGLILAGLGLAWQGGVEPSRAVEHSAHAPGSLAYEIIAGDQGIVEARRLDLPLDQITEPELERPILDDLVELQFIGEASKLAPALEELLAGAPREEPVEIVIALEPHGPMPRLPPLDPEEEPDSAANDAILEERRWLLEDDRAQALESQMPLVEKVLELGGEPGEQFALCNCFVARVPVAALSELAEDPSIVAIDPRFVDGGPTYRVPPRNQDRSSFNDPVRFRGVINTDAFFRAGYSARGISVGVIDSGVRASQRIFYSSAASTSPLRVRPWDCRDGGPTCSDRSLPGFDSEDTAQSQGGHGTSTIAVLNGLETLGSQYRGITEATVDSWRIGSGGRGDLAVYQLAVRAALARGNDVIVMPFELRMGNRQNSATLAADRVFDAGTAMIVGGGNQGSRASSAESPAISHRVLAVGTTKGPVGGGDSRGPTWDGRFKPDLQAPSDSETASATCDECLHSYPRTSGATPYVGGAAAILWDYLNQAPGKPAPKVLPGFVYAGLVAFGTHSTAFNSPDIRNPTVQENGLGLIKLGSPTRSHWVFGREQLGHQEAKRVPFEVKTGYKNLKVGLWWPDPPTAHNQMAVSIVDPSGRPRNFSLYGTSVALRLEVPGNLDPGRWTLILQGGKVQPGTRQALYYLAYADT